MIKISRLSIVVAHTSGFHLLGFSHLLSDQKKKKKEERERANKNSVVKGLLKSIRKASSQSLLRLLLIMGKTGDRYQPL